MVGVTQRSALSNAQLQQIVSFSATQLASLPRSAIGEEIALGEERRERDSRLADHSSGRSVAACSSSRASGEPRNSEMISTESTPAILPLASTTGAYIVSA